MNPETQHLLAHVSIALARYAKEVQREARANGSEVPRNLLALSEFVADCVRPRQETTPRAESGESVDGSPMTNGLLLTKREAASELSCSVRTLERLVAGGQLRTVPVGGRGTVRIRRSDLEAYVASLAPPSSSFLDAASRKDTA